MPRHFGNAVRNKIDHINACNALLLEQENSLAFLFAENCHQHIGPGDFTLTRTLHMKDRALQHTLKTQRGLRFTLFIVRRNERRGGVNELLEVMPQFVQIGPASPQNAGSRLVVEKRQQQVLDRHKFMTLVASLLESKVEGDFELSI